MNYQEILDFWFKELNEEDWWKKDENLDSLIKSKFLKTLKAAIAGELYEWREDGKGRLAEVIVLDQFSRNIFRGEKESFSQDAQALALAQEAVSLGVDKDFNSKEKAFLYLPYMHSESLKIHEVAVELFEQEGLENNFDFEIKHKKIIERFGRYPHRNEILGRGSTDEEKEFLKQDGSSF